MSSVQIDRQVHHLKRIADVLVPYSYPKVSFEDEQEILPLKQCVVSIDGYETVVCYSKSDHRDTRHTLETLQIQSIYSPFLPFSVVCKLGKIFLGSHHLSYVEFFRDTKKVYCWTLKRRDGQVVPPGKNTRPGQYEGFSYRILQPGTVDLH